MREAADGLSVPGRHQVVQQGVDSRAEVEENRGHQVEILRQVVQEIHVCVRVCVCLVEGCDILLIIVWASRCRGVCVCSGRRLSVCVDALLGVFVHVSSVRVDPGDEVTAPGVSVCRQVCFWVRMANRVIGKRVDVDARESLSERVGVRVCFLLV